MIRILPYYGDTKLGEDNTFFSTAVNKGIEVLVNRFESIYIVRVDRYMLDGPVSQLHARNLSSVAEPKSAFSIGFRLLISLKQLF